MDEELFSGGYGDDDYNPAFDNNSEGNECDFFEDVLESECRQNMVNYVVDVVDVIGGRTDK